MPNESKSNARRLISQSSVSINNEKHNELDEIIVIPSDGFLEVKIGKRGFYRIQQ